MSGSSVLISSTDPFQEQKKNENSVAGQGNSYLQLSCP